MASYHIYAHSFPSLTSTVSSSSGPGQTLHSCRGRTAGQRTPCSHYSCIVRAGGSSQRAMGEVSWKPQPREEPGHSAWQSGLRAPAGNTWAWKEWLHRRLGPGCAGPCATVRSMDFIFSRATGRCSAGRGSLYQPTPKELT